MYIIYIHTHIIPERSRAFGWGQPRPSCEHAPPKACAMSRQQGKADAWFPRVRNALCEAGSIFVFRQPEKKREKKLRGVEGFCALVTLLAELVAFLFFFSLEYEDTYIAV